MTRAALTLTFMPVAGNVGAVAVEPPPLGAFLPDEIGQIKQALAEHGVVFIRSGTLDVSAHFAFASQFGTVSRPSALIASLADEGYPDVGVISTDNGLAYSSDRWHSDVTWSDEPSSYSILHMQVTPPAGGDTMWSSQLAAFDALSEPTKRYLSGLTGHHNPPGRPEIAADHPVVCVHPLSGKPSLFVNGLFTTRINELSEGESEAVLAFLARHSTQPEFTCRWTWQPGDVAIWDNHFVQHYALGDYHPAARRIHRIEICGSPPIPAPEVPSL